MDNFSDLGDSMSTVILLTSSFLGNLTVKAGDGAGGGTNSVTP